MKVISTNISEPRTVLWRGKEIQTGIFKKPIDQPIYLGKEDVANDTVIDRVHHGGEFKACYLFGSDYYGYWKERYPSLDWGWGMFGENLTVEGLNENELYIGNVYKIGSAVVQVTEPRQPCHKLGIKFGDHKIIKEFIDYGHSGTYVRILTEGAVSTGDKLQLLEENKNPITVQEYNLVVNRKTKDTALIKKAIENDSIRFAKRERLKKMI